MSATAGRTPRAKLLHGSARRVEADFAGRSSGFMLLFEAMILMLVQQMLFAAVAASRANLRTG